MRYRPVAAALAGIAGTVAMTAAMRRLNRHLPTQARYPLPPRELVEQTTPRLPEPVAGEVTVAAHAGYGAATALALPWIVRRRPLCHGAVFGGVVWLLSYLGWIPASGLLKTATHHPPSRNLAMMAVHLVWGAVTALGYRELTAAQDEIFRGRARPDAHDDAPTANREDS